MKNCEILHNPRIIPIKLPMFERLESIFADSLSTIILLSKPKATWM
jgi:hypothetical protein